MIWTILGSGTSSGVPILTCKCSVCRSKNPKNKRTRASAWVQALGSQGKKSFVIDTGPDFRQQALRAGISRIDAVLYTHPHNDHLNGCDELRAYNYTQKSSIPIYGNRWLIDEIQARFPYIFSGLQPEGGIIPTLTPQLVLANSKPLELQGIPVTPLSLDHGSKETIGYRIDSVAYIVDCSYISPDTLERLKGLEVLILDCVRLEPHPTHLHLDKSLEIVAELRPKKTFLTHLGHDFDYSKSAKKLPRGVRFAYDGLKIEV